MAMCMAERKKARSIEPGLNLFSEENRGDKCDYALLKDSAIIEISNVGYNEIAYSPATLISLQPHRYICAASSRAQSKGRIIHDFALSRSLAARNRAASTVAKQHVCELPQHIRNNPCYPSGSSAYNEVNESY
jgi:hypothetical protein